MFQFNSQTIADALGQRVNIVELNDLVLLPDQFYLRIAYYKPVYALQKFYPRDAELICSLSLAIGQRDNVMELNALKSGPTSRLVLLCTLEYALRDSELIFSFC